MLNLHPCAALYSSLANRSSSFAPNSSTSLLGSFVCNIDQSQIQWQVSLTIVIGLVIFLLSKIMPFLHFQIAHIKAATPTKAIFLSSLRKIRIQSPKQSSIEDGVVFRPNAQLIILQITDAAAHEKKKVIPCFLFTAQHTVFIPFPSFLFWSKSL